MPVVTKEIHALLLDQFGKCNTAKIDDDTINEIKAQRKIGNK